MSKKVRMARAAAAQSAQPTPGAAPKAQPTTPSTPPAASVAKATNEPKAPKAPAPAKYVSESVIAPFGRKMRVAEYQDHTFQTNDQPDRQLTDEELAADWQGQFPRAVRFSAFHVKGARRDYNVARHSRTFAALGRPARPSVEYIIVEGKRVRVTDIPKTPKPPAKATPDAKAPSVAA